MPAVNLKEQDYVKIVSTDDETIVYQSQVLNGEVVAIDLVTRSIYIMDKPNFTSGSAWLKICPCGRVLPAVVLKTWP